MAALSLSLYTLMVWRWYNERSTRWWISEQLDKDKLMMTERVHNMMTGAVSGWLGSRRTDRAHSWLVASTAGGAEKEEDGGHFALVIVRIITRTSSLEMMMTRQKKWCVFVVLIVYEKGKKKTNVCMCVNHLKAFVFVWSPSCPGAREQAWGSAPLRESLPGAHSRLHGTALRACLVRTSWLNLCSCYLFNQAYCYHN